MLRTSPCENCGDFTMNAQASTTGWQLEALKHESFKHFVETHQLAGEAQLIACHPKGDSHRLPAAGKVRRPSHSRLQKAPRIMAGPLAANRQKGRYSKAPIYSCLRAILESWPPPTNTVTYDLMSHMPKIATKMALDHLLTPQRPFLNV